MRSGSSMIIGFDVREVLSNDAIELLETHDQMVVTPVKALVTADALVQKKPLRYGSQEDGKDPATSVLGCFKPTEALFLRVRQELQKGERVHIYRMHAMLKDYLEDRFGPIESTDSFPSGRHFKSIGFDVVDIDGWTSALWGCSYESWEKELWAPFFRDELNQHGLFYKELAAFHFAQCREMVIREHAPFALVEILVDPEQLQGA